MPCLHSALVMDVPKATDTIGNALSLLGPSYSHDTKDLVVTLNPSLMRLLGYLLLRMAPDNTWELTFAIV